MTNHAQLKARGAVMILALALAGCGGGGSSSDSSSSSSGGVVTATKLDVSQCLNQTVAYGRSLASIAVPDVLTLDMTKPSGFPNGRKLEDPVIDLELAALFLDLKTQPVDTLAKIPLDPSGNDEPYTGVFPYLAVAHGGAPAATGGAGFVFRADPATAYTRVDRMGEPAISTALIATSKKTAYNDDSPADDATGKWVPTITEDLTGLAEALQDDFKAANLKICATPAS